MTIETQEDIKTLIDVWRHQAREVRSDANRYGGTLQTTMHVEANTLDSCARQLEEMLQEDGER